MTFDDSTTVQSRTLTAFFDTREAADKAVADIQAAGIPRQDVSVVEGRSATAGSTVADVSGHEGFLESLKDFFMPEDDRYAYAEGLRRGGYLVAIKTGGASFDRVVDILDRDGAVDMDDRETQWRTEGWSGYRAETTGVATTGGALGIVAATAAVADGDDVIEVYEERLDVGKREVSHGRLRVRSYVVETAVNEQITLRSESVQVDRRTVDRAVNATDAMFQDRTIELEEFAEEAIISKEARVVEEITLRKEARDRTETIRDTVRRTEVEIEDERITGVGTSTLVGTSDVVEGSDTGRIVEHMDVIASDGTKVGTVDHMDGPDRIKLAKTTSPDGQHHFVPLAWVDHVDKHVHLTKTASEVKTAW